ncbi:hypothetical protein OIU76_017500 [Salix suchowensis]|nr:hypothetical protein OIU76_017500 [Salix suchowensis]KAJ6341371.1 hypothetical protein OIU78_009526 [Salix suchowensis]
MRQGLELPNQFTLASLLQAFVSLVKSISHVVKICMPSVEALQMHVQSLKYLGRLGHLDKTVKLVKEIPFVPSAMVWWSLLSACVVHNDVELGRISAQHVLEIELEDEATHAILLNIYANARRWGKVASIRKSMKRKGVRKEQGISWAVNEGGVHYFSVGDISHLGTMIKGMLEWLNMNARN